MSDSNWGGRIAFVGCGLAILFILWGLSVSIYSMGFSSGLHQAEADGYAAEYPTDTEKRIADCLNGGFGPDSAKCIEEAIASSHESQRSEQDLQAQRNMSEWAFWMLVIAGASLAVTTIGTIFLAWQVRLTREAVEDTEKATNAMFRQNQLTADAQRAWIDLIPNLEIRRLPNGTIDLKAGTTVKNIGKTIATNVRYTSRFRTGDLGVIHEEMNSIFRELIAQDRGFSLMPGKEIKDGQSYGGKQRGGIRWDEYGRAAICIISIAVYEIQGEPKKRYSRALWRATQANSDLTPGDFKLTWEDITSGNIVIGKHDWLITS